MAGKHNRDRGRRQERRGPTAPRAVSIETVDAHTLLLRVPVDLPPEGLESIVLHVRGLCRVLDVDPGPIEAAGVWLTPQEVAAMSDVPLPGFDDE